MEHFPSRDEVSMMGMKAVPQIRGELMVNEPPIEIKDLGKVTQIATGLDHVIFLTSNGTLKAMGDDTFGQCGTGGDGRAQAAPFFEARHRRPVDIEFAVD